MNKSNVVRIVATTQGYNIKDVERIISAALSVIATSLIAEERVALDCFGVFNIKKMKARQHYSPKQKTKYELPEHNRVIFTPAKALKEGVR